MKQPSKKKPAKPAAAAGAEPRKAAVAAEPAAAEAPETPPSAGPDEAPAAKPAPPEVAALQDRMLRLQADFENFRRRTQRERGETYRRANEDLLDALLPVLDHFELGFANAVKHEVNASVIDGFRLVFDQALQALGKFGLKPLEAEGEPFDPHHHEAVTQMPSEEFPPDTVMAQTRRGYMLGDRLLRAAQVVVSSGPGPAEPDAAPNDAPSPEENGE